MTRMTGPLLVNVSRLASYCVGAAVFLLFCTPSIKIFLNTGALNVAPVLLLVVAAALNPPSAISRTHLQVLVILCALFVVLFGFGVYNSASLDLVQLVKYAILCLLTIAVSLLTDRRAMRLALILIVAWALVLAYVQLSRGIALKRDEGQNYLTVGYAVGSGLLIGMISFLAARSVFVKVVGLACFLVTIAAAFTLLGRGPLLLPLLVIVSYVLFNTAMDPRVPKLVIGMTALTAIVVFVLSNLQEILAAGRVFSRLAQLANVGESSRAQEIYLPAIEAIADQPLGIGLAAHEQVIGAYPHNIFLELLISGGVIAFLVFLLLVGLFFRHAPLLLRDGVALESKAFYLLGAYYFLAWNLSFNFSSAYAVLPLIVLFASRSSEQVRGLAVVVPRHRFHRVNMVIPLQRPNETAR